MTITYEYGNTHKQETISFRYGDIIIAGDYIGLLRLACSPSPFFSIVFFNFQKEEETTYTLKYIGRLDKEQKPTEEFYLGIECFQPIKDGHDGRLELVEYFQTRFNKNSGILIPFSQFKCKVPELGIIQFFFQWYLRAIGVLDQFSVCLFAFVMCVCVISSHKRALDLTTKLLGQMKESEQVIHQSTDLLYQLNSNSSSQTPDEFITFHSM
ncbi:hypothetical protein RFI_23501, partial [Reticulomyxa filosa]